MKIKALGAVGTVTGSCFRLEMDNGNQVLVDCGLFQGGRQTELRNSNTSVYDPLNISAIVITHAHMDHTGLVPALVKAGYRGPVYATAATCELLKVLWLDAANIQEQEAEWKSRKNRRQGQKDVEPLYTESDAAEAMTLLRPVDYEEPRELVPGLTLRYFQAGHILGAASIHLTVEEEGQSPRSIAFSGDLGRDNQLLMPNPEKLPPADTIFMETTYGNRLHKDMGPSVDELIQAINDAYRDNGKILIPAFAVERSQEILLLLAKAWHDGSIPKDLPIILDSPLATSALEIYTRYVHLFDDETQAFLKQGFSEGVLPTLKITRDAQESKKINDITGSAIIVAGSGMANAGRIMHHLKHNLWRPNCHVIFVGFQAQGTTGRRLVEGAKLIKIHREPINVEAKIHTIGGFSGHADQKELLAWLGRQAHPGLTVNLIHGEASSTQAFYELARQTYPEINFHIPQWLKYAALANQPVPAAEAEAEAPETPAVDTRGLTSLLNRLERLRAQAGAVSGLPPAQLAELEAYLSRAEDLLLR